MGLAFAINSLFYCKWPLQYFTLQDSDSNLCCFYQLWCASKVRQSNWTRGIPSWNRSKESNCDIWSSIKLCSKQRKHNQMPKRWGSTKKPQRESSEMHSAHRSRGMRRLAIRHRKRATCLHRVMMRSLLRPVIPKRLPSLQNRKASVSLRRRPNLWPHVRTCTALQ